ncbi:MAG TPA: hypothetical protein VI729_05160 [Anaerolineales bacterium]|nr:hypothetical protein [Anaerolineales bacterium]
MHILQVEVGKVYRITHKRKGTFVAQVIGVEQADPSDKVDSLFITVKYDVREGTDQARLSIEEGKQAVRVSNLRPSLVENVELLEEESWLRTVRVREEHKAEAGTIVEVQKTPSTARPKTVGERVAGLFRRGGKHV